MNEQEKDRAWDAAELTEGNATANENTYAAEPTEENTATVENTPAEADALSSPDEPAVQLSDTPTEPTEVTAPKPLTRHWVAVVALASALALTLGVLIGMLLVQHWKGDIPITDAALAIAEARESVVVVEVSLPLGEGIGTGVILTADGYIATNHHVIDGANAVRVFFTDGSMAEAEVVGFSAMDDLAVLKVDKKGLRAATFATTQCFVGQRVYAIGTPGSTQLAWTTTEGIVSFVDREIAFYDDFGDMEKKMILLQVDAMLNPGNSGGPVINERGEVVGIVSVRVEHMAQAEPDGDEDVMYTGLGFALPAAGAQAILQAIIRDGHAEGITSTISFKPAAMGIQCHYVKANGDYPVSGMYVTGVIDGSAADGVLQEGDILTEVGGYEVTDKERLLSIIHAYLPGDRVDVVLYRDGEILKVTLTLGEAE